MKTDGSLLAFPRGFLWGTASSGYQVEGNNSTSDWTEWERQPGRIAQGQRSGRACDWWSGDRWQEDFDRAAADGHTAHRLSVEWSRVEPEPGKWDSHALEHYRRIVAGLRERGIEPMVTLHHFVNPQWLTERQAWETGSVVPLFEAYTRRVVAALRDHVTTWCTINEPNVFMLQGWVSGIFPPGAKKLGLAMEVARQVLRAHAASYRAIHELQPGAQVGLPIHFRPMTAARPRALDRLVARKQFNTFSSVFPDAIRTGRMRSIFGSTAVPEARGTMDWFGLNYYTADVVTFDLGRPGELFGRREFPPGTEVDDAGIYASYPQGLAWSLDWARRILGLPVYITENGIGDQADIMRPRYILTHLREVWRHIQAGGDVRGYYHWSLVDNFEWERAWTHRFGLYAMDPETLERSPRKSAFLYAEICRAGGISQDMVARYSPELADRFFEAGA
jgi:beta-glucosidase